MSFKKDYERKQKVAKAVEDLEEQKKLLRQYVKDLEDQAVQAELMDQSEFATELLEAATEMEEFANDLDFVTLKVVQNAKTATIMAQLSDLPKVVKACGQILCEVPNFKALGKGFAKINSKSHDAMAALRQFREKSRRNSDDGYAKLFGRDPKTDPKHQQLLEQKKRALELKIAQKTDASAPVDVADKNAAVTSSDVADIDSIAKMLDDKKRQ